MTRKEQCKGLASADWLPSSGSHVAYPCCFCSSRRSELSLITSRCASLYPSGLAYSSPPRTAVTGR